MRDLQAISSELARRRAAEQQDGGGQSAGSAAPAWAGGNPNLRRTPTPADTDVGVEKNAIEASQGIPTIDAIHTSTPECVDRIPDLDLPLDEGGNSSEPTPPLRGFRGRWLSRDRNMPDDASDVGLFDEAAGGTPSVDWDADSVPANPEPTIGVVVDERDAKVLANHTFLSNVKWSSISMPWESGFMKKHFW